MLSALNSLKEIDQLHVFGMNFAGGFHHIDFVNPIVEQCCSKCVFHPTPTSDYGDGMIKYTMERVSFIVTTSVVGGSAAIGVVVVAAVGVAAATHRFFVRRRRRKEKNYGEATVIPSAVRPLLVKKQ